MRKETKSFCRRRKWKLRRRKQCKRISHDAPSARHHRGESLRHIIIASLSHHSNGIPHMVHAGDASRMLASKKNLLELIKICFANFSHNSQSLCRLKRRFQLFCDMTLYHILFGRCSSICHHHLSVDGFRARWKRAEFVSIFLVEHFLHRTRGESEMEEKFCYL